MDLFVYVHALIIGYEQGGGTTAQPDTQLSLELVR